MGRGFIILEMVNVLVAITGSWIFCQPIIFGKLLSKTECPIPLVLFDSPKVVIYKMVILADYGLNC